MDAIHLPLTGGYAEEYLRDIEVDKEIRKLPDVSDSVKEYIIGTRHLQYGLYDEVLPTDISKEDVEKVKEVYSQAMAIKVQKGLIVAFNPVLDEVIKMANRFGGLSIGLSTMSNVIASFVLLSPVTASKAR